MGVLATARATLRNCVRVAQQTLTLYVWVQILVPQPKNSTSFDLSNFFIHCESNGISSRFSVYLITEGAYHQPQAVSSFAMMIYNGKPLVIYNSCGIDDMHAYGVIWREVLAILPIL